MIILTLLFVLPTLKIMVNGHDDSAKISPDNNVTSVSDITKNTDTTPMSIGMFMSDGNTGSTVSYVRRTESERQCLSSLILLQHGGRFGNLFIEYASALGFTKRLNEVLPHDRKHVFALTSDDWESLTKVFDGVRQKTIADVMQQRKTRRHGKRCSEVIPDPDSLVQNETQHWERAYYYPKLAAGNKSFVLRMNEGLEPAIASVAREMRDTLRFTERLRRRAERMRRLMVEKVKMRADEWDVSPNEAEVLVVGMHARRTDYVWMFSRPYFKTEANETYFVDALRWMIWTLRTELPPRQTLPVRHLPLRAVSLNATIDKYFPREVRTPPPQKIPTLPLIAVAVFSDDMPWVREKLIPALHRFIRNEKVLGIRVFGAGSRHAMVDLALLSQCNHTILSYGTFGATAAILSGGRTVVYFVDFVLNFVTNIAKFFPNWVILRQ